MTFSWYNIIILRSVICEVILLKFKLIYHVDVTYFRKLSVRQFNYKSFFLSLICCIFFAGCTPSNLPVSDTSFKFESKLLKCVDGDTAWFILDDVNEKVRFLSIDAPELNDGHPDPFALEASAFTCEMLEGAETIYLEFDPKSSDRDKYDRLLAWVWIDDVLLNLELVKDGYAVTKYMFDDYLYNDLLIESELIAKENNIGVWSND